MSAGAISGILIRRRSAARSSRRCGPPRRSRSGWPAARCRCTIMLKPTPPQTAMLAIATEDRAPAEAGRAPAGRAARAAQWNGLTAGRYRKPHSSEAITPGTAYGRKIEIREKRRQPDPRRSPAAARTAAPGRAWSAPGSRRSRSTRPTLSHELRVGRARRGSSPARRRLSVRLPAEPEPVDLHAPQAEDDRVARSAAARKAAKRIAGRGEEERTAPPAGGAGPASPPVASS